MRKRLMGIFFSLCLILSLMSMTAWAQGSEADETVFASTSEAGIYLREQMKKKEDTIRIHFKTAENATDGAVMGRIISDIMQKALEHTGKPWEGDALFWNLKSLGDGKLYNCIPDNQRKPDSICYFDLVYHLDYFSTKAQDAATASKLAGLSFSGTDYQKVKAIYDYVVGHVSYYRGVSKDASRTSYGALIDGSAVCQGYATLFYNMCLMNGIDTRIIIGTADKGATAFNVNSTHAWNIVKLGSKYYNVDTTWAASATDDRNKWLLRGDSSAQFPRHIRGYAVKGWKDYDYQTASFASRYPMASEVFGCLAGNHSWKNAYTIDEKATYREKGTKSIHCRYCNARKSITSTPKLQLAKPSSKKLKLSSYNKVKVSWKKVSGASAYKVAYKKSSASKWTVKTVSKTSFTTGSLKNGVKYQFKVKAVTKNSSGKIVNKGNYGGISGIYTLKKMKSPVVKKAASGRAKVAYTKINGATGYQISISSSKSKKRVVVTINKQKDYSKIIQANKGKVFYYSVRAYKTVDGVRKYAPWSKVKKYRI